MRKPLSTSILPFALSTGLPFAVRAGKANVFFVQSGGNLTRSHISPERNELRSRRYAGRATEFLCDEWLGARQSANSSFLRGSVSLCEPFRVSNATGPRSLEKKSESLFVHRRTYEPFSCRTFGARSCRRGRENPKGRDARAAAGDAAGIVPGGACAPSIARRAISRPWRFVFARSAGAALTSSEEFC